jgi:deoxyribodipyrimidine photo-lyase
MDNRGILWFRNDLRLDDNESLHEALSYGQIIPVFVFDTRTFKGSTRAFGFRKTGIHRAKFIIEAVHDLRNQLQKLGSNLVVRSGKSEEIVAEIAAEQKAKWVFCNRERTDEERKVQDALESKLWELGLELRFSRGKMLYHTADLPFPVSQTPEVFTQFRKEVERIVQVRRPIPAPQHLHPLPENLNPGEIPTLAQLDYQGYAADDRSVLPFRGGATTALNRLNYYLWQSDLAQTYKETRNGLIGSDYSTKFSPWLALGCISPKRIYHELKAYENERGANDSTYWIFFELLWRDFFRLMAKKHENSIFKNGGPKGESSPRWTENRKQFTAWANGDTGVPFVDANMRELNATGFMSNRGRQNVASFLVKDLNINWQMGAEYFESLLIDYDVASNWGNWNYVAGVGSDPRENRYFNILTQAQRYDAQGEYVKLWIPTLKDVPAEKIHRPDTLSDVEQSEYGVQIGTDYPQTLVPTSKWDKGPKSRKPSRAPRKRGGRRRGNPQFDF